VHQVVRAARAVCSRATAAAPLLQRQLSTFASTAAGSLLAAGAGAWRMLHSWHQRLVGAGYLHTAWLRQRVQSLSQLLLVRCQPEGGQRQAVREWLASGGQRQAGREWLIWQLRGCWEHCNLMRD
jgi:hypothetical protein